MSKAFVPAVLHFAMIGLLASLLPPGTAPALAGEGEYEFTGVKKCSLCHKKDASGNQYGIWLEGPHAKTYETLASEKALAIAKEKGIENPQESPQCLKCHITAFPVMGDLENQKITLEEGVSCESCHGAGSGYYKKAVMRDVTDGKIEPASVGLVIPTEETCTRCHNEESPTFDGFDFEKMYAKIAHPIPEGAASEDSD